jgi:serine/threonine protein kinase
MTPAIRPARLPALSDGSVARLRDALERPELPSRYDPIEIVGHGGMGVVWRAHDRVLERDVAVKVIAPHHDDPSLSARLAREARILAHLEHPGLVPVHDVGVMDDGRAWYVMRLVKGTRLDVAAAGIATRGELLRIVERLCDTVAYAHAHNVVHRDLKPGNVMIGPFGEVLVLDWGVASTGPDATGVVVGTPGYMSPEQAAGQPADERSDVFGIGAILRELVAVHGEVPKRLTSICDRATAARASDRYESPRALADDIRRFLDGERVLAHREGFLEMLDRVITTYRTPILLVLAYLVMRIAILLWRGV